MRKMQAMDNLDRDQAIALGSLTEGDNEPTIRNQMHYNIKDTKVNLVNTLQMIVKEGRDLSVRANPLKRTVEMSNY